MNYFLFGVLHQAVWAVSKKRPKPPMLDIPLYENVFQNPELFPTQASLSPKQSTLTPTVVWSEHLHGLWSQNTYADCGQNIYSKVV
jgi:hypothetical protein